MGTLGRLMSTRNYVEELEYQDSRGMDTTTPLPMLADGYVRSAENCNLSKSSGYEKRLGYTPQLTSLTGWTSLAIRSGVEYRDSVGAIEIILFGTDDTAVAKLGSVVSGAVATLADVTPAYTHRVSMLQFGDTLQLVNGDTSGGMPVVYDGTKVRDIGIPAPTTFPGAAPPPVEITPGDLNNGGSYVWAITYVREVGGQKIAESSPSTTYSFTTTGANKGVQFTLAIDTGAGYKFNNGTDYVPTHVYLYRTVGDGNILFFEQKVAYVSGTIDSIASDASLFGQMEEDNSQYSIHGDGKPRYGIVARNRVFYVMDDNLVIHSKIGQIGPMPESFEAKAQSSTEGERGGADRIIGLGVANDIPIVVKERSVGRLDEVGIPNLLAVDNVAYVYREISSVVGGVEHFGGVSVHGEYAFLGRDNIYATDGGVVRPIGDRLASIITALSFESGKSYKVSAGNDTKEQRLYFSVFKDTGAVEPNYVLVGDYQRYPEFRWTVYSPGTDISTHPGIQAGCFFPVTSVIDGSEEMHFGNSWHASETFTTDFNGQYYRMNDGNSDIVDVVVYASYTNTINLDTGLVSLIGTPIGIPSPSVLNGVLDLTGDLNRYLSYSAAGNVDDTLQQGSINIKWIPNFTGTPASDTYLCEIAENAGSTNNQIEIMVTTAGNYSISIKDSAGVPLISTSYAGTFTAGVEQEVELNFDLTLGETRFFINGVKVFEDVLTTGTRDNSLTIFYMGSDETGTSKSDFSINNFSIFPRVRHIGDYTPTGSAETAMIDAHGIYFNLKTRAYSIKQPNIIKLWKNCGIQASAEDSSYLLTVSAAFDLSVTSTDAQTFNIFGSDDTWDSKNWAPGANPLTWAGSNLAELIYDPHQKAKYIQLIFSQTEANAPVALMGWNVGGVIFGPQKATTS